MSFTNDAAAQRVEAYFQGYGADFDNEDWPSFVGRYQEPAFSVRPDGTVKTLSNHAEVDKFFREVSAAWRAEGYRRFRISGVSALQLGTQSVLATLTWHLLRADGTQIRQWRQSYQLLRRQGEWRVLCSTFHAA